ncbi:MAG: DUF2911 domain-containing protein [Spirosomataceae bacterium]
MRKYYQLSLSFVLLTLFFSSTVYGQALRLPENNNFVCSSGRKIGVTDIEIKWNAPGVKGREGKIWGTDVAYFGYAVLGYGSNVESPWRAGADECTTISVSTDVKINGKTLPAGKYALFMLLTEDSTTLIFNKNTAAWGSYFYRKDLDVMRVSTRQKKNQPNLIERLTYQYSNQTENSIDVSLDWERWSIPFKIEVDLKKTTLAYLQREMSGAIGFDPASLEAAAAWCLSHETNYEEALNWINSASDPALGGLKNFRTLSIKSKLLDKVGRKEEATTIIQTAIENASALELNSYGRQLLMEKKITEAMAVYEKNYQKHKGAWPTNAGMMNGYSAVGNLKKALEHAKLALAQAPNEQIKKFLEKAVKTLEEGKPL